MTSPTHRLDPTRAFESYERIQPRQGFEEEISQISPTATMTTFSRSDYVIGWICALPLEMMAAKAMLDIVHPTLPNPPHDYNTYTLGKMGTHNVVIACMPIGVYGMTSATGVASQMLSSFPSIRFGLMVGIGGGAPHAHADIWLGDVVVSKPTEHFGGVVQYDYGKTVQEGVFKRTGTLNKPPQILLTAISSLQADHGLRSGRISALLSEAVSRYPTVSSEFAPPDHQFDRLFVAEYEHVQGEDSCEKCDSKRLVARPPRAEQHPVIHYGLIASANQVMKHAITRDRLADELGILCFEMEAGGLMDSFPCLIIRGICDYADTHKNRQWQGYAAGTAAAYAKELLTVVPTIENYTAPTVVSLSKALTDTLKIAGVPDTVRAASAILPFRRDRDFVERPILSGMMQRTSEPGARVGLVGLGGVGKSQLAIEYAYRARDADPTRWVFWVHASSGVRFEESYRKIAAQLRLPGWNQPKADILNMVHGWLSDESNGRWTMIVDNADDVDVMFEPWNTTPGATATSADRSVSEFLPLSLSGSIVVTSRSQEVVSRLQVHDEDILEVRPMEVDVARELFFKKLKKSDRGSSADEVVRLVTQLDCMPLAISQAAAYIDQCTPRMTISKYIEILEKNDHERAALLQKDILDSRRDRQASNSIIKTWYVTFTKLRQIRNSAARLLALMSLFDREAIPESLLRGNYEEALDSETDFEDDIAALRAYGLIGIGMSNDLFDMHRLVQLSTQKWLEMGAELVEWQERYIDVMGAAFPRGDYANWVTCHALFPHVEVMKTYRVSKAEHLKVWAKVLCNGSWYAWQRGQYDKAENMVRHSLGVYQELLGQNEVENLKSINMLALVLSTQGKYNEAEEMNRRALAGCETVLGVDHPDTLTSMSNLALVLGDQGKYTEAEEMNRRALARRETVLGVNHPDTLTSMSNLALALGDQGKYTEAEEMNRRALARRETVLGVNHPDTLTSMSNLAIVLWYQGKYTEAEEMNRRALAGRETVLGVDHPDTLTSVYCLAYLLADIYNYDEALRLYDRAIVRYDKALGSEHPTTKACRNNQAFLLRKMRQDC